MPRQCCSNLKTDCNLTDSPMIVRVGLERLNSTLIDKLNAEFVTGKLKFMSSWEDECWNDVLRPRVHSLCRVITEYCELVETMCACTNVLAADGQVVNDVKVMSTVLLYGC